MSLGGYTEGDLAEAADVRLDQAHIGQAGETTGVALPDWVQAGALLSSTRARTLGAQLIRAADLHDSIIDRAISEHVAAMRRR